jgi:hypothetical protein
VAPTRRWSFHDLCVQWTLGDNGLATIASDVIDAARETLVVGTA